MKPEVILLLVIGFAGVYTAMILIINEAINQRGESERRLYWLEPAFCLREFVEAAALALYDFVRR